MTVVLEPPGGKPGRTMRTTALAFELGQRDAREGESEAGRSVDLHTVHGWTARLLGKVTSIDIGNRATIDDGSGPVEVVSLGGPMVALIKAYKDGANIELAARLDPNGTGIVVMVTGAKPTTPEEPDEHVEVIEWADIGLITGTGRVRVTVIARPDGETVGVERQIIARSNDSGSPQYVWIHVADLADAARLMAEAALRLYARRARAARQPLPVEPGSLAGHFGATHFHK